MKNSTIAFLFAFIMLLLLWLESDPLKDFTYFFAVFVLMHAGIIAGAIEDNKRQ